jgi:AbiV family abortive infection protein
VSVISRCTKRSEPVILPASIVREGCLKIADNIYEFSDHANRFLDFSEEIISPRIAYVLVIHAMDEAGKLIEIMRKMVDAERDHASEISVEGFYSHRIKGSEAGTIGLLAIDWLERMVAQVSLDKATGNRESFVAYRTHLERLRMNFSFEREHALYVNLEGDRWLSPVTPSSADIGVDAYLLESLALLTQLGLAAGRSFTELSDIAQQVTSLNAQDLANVSRNGHKRILG